MFLAGEHTLSEEVDQTAVLRAALREIASATRVLVEQYRDSGAVGVPRDGVWPTELAARLAVEWQAETTVEGVGGEGAPGIEAPVGPEVPGARISNVHVSAPRVNSLPSIDVGRASPDATTADVAAPHRALFAVAAEATAPRAGGARLGFDVPASREARVVRLAAIANEAEGCSRCGLRAGRKQVVVSRGNPSAALMFVGEGPGADEDAQGLPFVGKAGQLLDKMIAAMGLGPDDVYITNIVKCRPPNNRKPEPDEMAACMPFLSEQLALVEPRVVVALGATAAEGLLGTRVAITRARGQWKLYRTTIPLMLTYHPAYLLRSPEAKREVWADLQAVLARLGRPLPKRGS